MKVSVLIPVYNEVKTISEILIRVAASPIADEIIVIDDGSTDGTKDIVKQISGPRYKILLQDKNEGKGSAIRKGLTLVTGDIVIIQDADLEYDPKDYPVLVGPIISGKADIVYGSRWLCHGLDKIPLNLFRLGRWIVTMLTNALYGVWLTDVSCGYKVFKTKVLKEIPLECRRFEFCPEVTAKALRRGYKIHEVSAGYTPRSIAEGKKITYKDGLVAVLTLIKYRFFK